METLQEMLDNRNKAIDACRKISEKPENDGKSASDWSAEDKQEFDRAKNDAVKWKKSYNTKLDDVNRDTFLKESLEERNNPANERITDPNSHTDSKGGQKKKFETVSWNPLGDSPKNKHAKRSFRKNTAERGSEEYNTAFNRYINGTDPTVAFKDHQTYNALQSDDAQQGGYFITSEEWMAGILRLVDDAVYIQQNSRVIIVKNARSLGIRKRTAKASAFDWGPELRDITETADTSLRFGKRVLTPHYATGMIQVSRDLLRNAVDDPESIVMYEMGINAREFLEKAYLFGDGNEKCLGLFVANTEGISTARDIAASGTTTFTFDDLQKAKFKLKLQYRSRAKWMFHRNNIAAISLLKTDFNYLWQPSRQVGEPDRLLGLEYIESEWLPSTMTTGLYYGMLGDFSHYIIAFALEMEILRLNEIAARTNQVEYHMRLKVDANVDLEEAFVRLALA